MKIYEMPHGGNDETPILNRDMAKKWALIQIEGMQRELKNPDTTPERLKAVEHELEVYIKYAKKEGYL